MAMYDWNQNGKSDMGDNFIDYQIYKDSTPNSDNYSGNSNSSGSGIWFFILFVVVVSAFCKPLGVLILFGYTWILLLR